MIERTKGPRGSVRSNWFKPNVRVVRVKKRPRETDGQAFRIVRDPSDGTEQRIPIVRKSR